MKKKRIFSIALLNAMLIGGTVLPMSTPVLANDMVSESSEVEVKETAPIKDYIPLTSLNYISGKVGYGQIRNNANVDGKTMKFLVDGKVTSFVSGISAHAESTLIYDISKISNEYEVFDAYVGVDYAAGESGNGVKFQISVSDDNENWQVIKETGTFNKRTNAEHISVNVKGKKYLKLFADNIKTGKNSDTWCDHSQYCNPKFIKQGHKSEDVLLSYSVDGIDSNEVLKNGTMSEEMDTNVLKQTFINRYADIMGATVDKDVADAIDYIFNNKEVLKLFVDGGEIDGGSYTAVMLNWADIYKAHKNDFTNKTYLKIAVATSLSHSHAIKFWNGGIDSDPVIRYEKVKGNYDNGAFDKAGLGFGKSKFDNLHIELMRWITDNQMNDADMDWLTWYAGEKKSIDAYSYIAYQYDMSWNYSDDQYYSEENKAKWDKKYGLNNFTDSDAIYGQKGVVRPYIVFEEGSVCGGLAKTYANLRKLYGHPSAVIGQPGHAATLAFYIDANGHYRWSILNNVSGWTASEKGERMLLGWGYKSAHKWVKGYNASYILTSSAALEDATGLEKAQHLNYLASMETDNAKKIALYKKAIEAQAINLDAWEGLVNASKNDSDTDWVALATDFSKALGAHPKAYSDFLDYIKTLVPEKDKNMMEQLRYATLTRVSNQSTSTAIDKEVTNIMAKSLLGTYKYELATFSFDDDTIRLSNESKGMKWRYSTDNGLNWSDADGDEVVTEVTDDILINPIGADWNYAIRFRYESPDKYNLQADEDNQTITGDTSLLQIQKNGKWVAFDKNEKLYGTVIARIKGHDNILPTAPFSFTFKEEKKQEMAEISIPTTPLKAYHTFAGFSLTEGADTADYVVENGKVTVPVGEKLYTVWNSNKRARYSRFSFVNDKELAEGFESLSISYNFDTFSNLSYLKDITVNK